MSPFNYLYNTSLRSCHVTHGFGSSAPVCVARSLRNAPGVVGVAVSTRTPYQRRRCVCPNATTPCSHARPLGERRADFQQSGDVLTKRMPQKMDIAALDSHCGILHMASLECKPLSARVGDILVDCPRFWFPHQRGSRSRARGPRGGWAHSSVPAECPGGRVSSAHVLAYTGGCARMHDACSSG